MYKKAKEETLVDLNILLIKYINKSLVVRIFLLKYLKCIEKIFLNNLNNFMTANERSLLEIDSCIIMTLLRFTLRRTFFESLEKVDKMKRFLYVLIKFRILAA